MPLIAINNLEKVLGDRLLFDKLAFAIEKGERVGLIGNNGEGKTTLFKMMTGEMTPDVGDVSVPKGTKIGYLKQDVELDPKNTVIDEAELGFAELHNIAHEMRELEHKMAEPDVDLEKILAKYETLQHDFEDKGGYAFRHKLEATLQGVGLPESMWEVNVEKLSGGQRSRVALAKLLIAEPDLLLLDEPTNHLDIAAIEWLEDYLIAFQGAVLTISHDRYMLDRVCNRIAWLTQRKIKTYPGNFTKFLELKELEELSQARAHELQQKDIAKQEEFIRRFGAGQRAREAQGRLKKLERFKKSDAIVDAVQGTKAMGVAFSGTGARAGDQLLRVEGLTKSFGSNKVWNDLTFNVKPGQRIGIIGPNGTGKTTLLKTLLGEIPADSGDVRWGTNLDIGYYDQRLDEFDPNNTILEECHDGTMPEKKVRDTLGSLLFTGDTVDKRMGDLSGGERARVALAQLMLEKPNVILLDEPTNHLDVQSAAALEQTLNDFDGTLLIVSHDRYFLSKIVNRLLVLGEKTGLTDFEGTFDEWQAKSHAMTQAASAAGKAKPASPAPKQQAAPAKQQPQKQSGNNGKKDNPYARKFGQLSMGELERQISDTEAEIGATQTSLSRAGRDAGKSKALSATLNDLTGKLKELEAEYFLREA